MFGTFGWVELFLILTIVLVVYGAGKLPQVGEGLGKAVHGFKRTMRDDETKPPPAEDPSTDQRQDIRTARLPEEDHRHRL